MGKVSEHKNDGKGKFNKKAWRQNQYSHKQKVDEWKSRRNFAVVKGYEKMLKKEKIHHPSPQNAGEQLELERTRPQKRLSEFQKAKLEYENKKKEIAEKKEAAAKRNAEREEAVKMSKQKKIQRLKKLTQKTRKGQPVMKGRIELLLEKIQKQVAAEK